MDPATFPIRSGTIANDGSTFSKPNECLGPKTDSFEDHFAVASTSSKTSFTDPGAFADNIMKTDVGTRETSSHLDEIVQKEGPGPGGDTSECTESKMVSNHEPIGIDAVMTEIDREVKMECMQWTPIFVESEQFEMLSSGHVDKLLQDAHALEENLIEQKERLLSHLARLSQTLKLNVP